MPLTLAIIEHLEKIAYLFSMFLPVAVFFLFGIGLSYWYSREEIHKFSQALATHEILCEEFNSLSKESQILTSEVTSLIPKVHHEEVEAIEAHRDKSNPKADELPEEIEDEIEEVPEEIDDLDPKKEILASPV